MNTGPFHDDQFDALARAHVASVAPSVDVDSLRKIALRRWAADPEDSLRALGVDLRADAADANRVLGVVAIEKSSSEGRESSRQSGKACGRAAAG